MSGRSGPGTVAREGDTAAEQVAAGGEVPVSDATRSLVASPGGGTPIPDAVRARIEPHLGADLTGVQVHTGAAAAAAAAELQARAFTVGAHIFLGDGQSVGDLELMGHEATHVVQQVALDTWRAPVARDFEATDLLPDFIIDGVTSAVQAVPGYALVGMITGKDPLTDEPVRAPDLELVEKVLTWGPFGAAVGPVLQGVEILADIVAYLRERMAAHDLTWDRISADVSAAWDEMGVTEGISGNVAIVERYVDAFLADVRALVDEVKDTVIEKVRAVVAGIAEPLLQRPEIAPPWNLAVKAFHHDPLTGQDVAAPTVEILGDFLRLIGKGDVVDQMTERRTLQETADWLDTMWGRFKGLLGQAGALFSAAWDAISPSNLPQLLDTLPALADRALALVADVGAFAWDVVAKVLELVKKSLLGWLSEHAHEIPGFHLLTVILEKNPFTDEPVPRTGENLIRGFVTLLPGGAAMYDQLAESGAIAQAGARIDGAVASLGISWELIVSTFKGVWDLVTLEKLLSPVDTFNEITAKFGEPLGRIFEFISVVVQVVIELVLRMMNFPPELVGNVIANATAAIDDIVADPVGFLLNLIAAMKAGFSSFFGKIGTYLLNGLADWLFRGLSKIGVARPTELTLEAAITLIVQISGITVEVIWQKLATHLGQETVDRIRGAVAMAGEAFAFVKEVQEGGFSAIWARLTEKLSMLWDTLFDMVKDWIMTEIVDAAIAKVLSMLDPTGIMAVINGAIAFFRAVQSVLDYVRELLEIVDSYVSTIGAIAKGDVGPGAAMLEGGLAAAVPVAIGFLANQVGLGDAPEKIAEFVIGLREKLFEALDWLIERAVAMGRGALAALTGGGEEVPQSGEPADDGSGPLFDGSFDLGAEHHLISYDEAAGTLSVASDNTQPVADVAPARTVAQILTDLFRAHKQAPGTHGRRRQIRAAIAELKAVLIANPAAWGQAGDIGHAPNVGSVAPHKRKGEGWRPVGAAPSFLEVWELTSEHVIPDMFFTEYLEGLDLPATSEDEYRAMTTIMIYKGAADEKTKSDHTARSALGRDIRAVPKQTYTKLDGSLIERRSLLAVTRLMRNAANAAVGRTYAAVLFEEDMASTSTPGKTRGQVRGGGPKPTQAEIASAREQQWAALQDAFRGDQEARDRELKKDTEEDAEE
ncbi:eCIS core domain-containing protein [Cellulomonas xiejunii]|uniref:DUF4157 domain-containing protein n=1 Tax=Cellulomonas xiejunii TaxID=2968083 RepID=A0ABY5KKH7_9CELL|nr:DUF4157 domain-containing protein [Cellulomonas xiejunii]MCC2320726.1 DUF4157 domain-containing protein [Cellulomonas xiejunii]UUI71014.1 DUF4157 domain-containing protein [Cellulomonas xiejunii]